MFLLISAPEKGMPDKMKFFIRHRTRLYITAVLCLFLLAGAIGMVALPQYAYALRVTMKRVIFEGPRRTELLTIVNNTAEEQVFRLGWRNMRMSEDHSLEFVKEGDSLEGLKPAEDMVRFSPRRVVLPPGASQQIRLMLRRPKDLPEGEYRSHFWIQPEAEAVKFKPNPEKKNEKGPTVQIKMLTGMTVPVFVRNGNLTANVTFSNATITPEGNGIKVKLTVNREGQRSVYGDMKLYCVGSGGEVLQRESNGIAIYTEVGKRNMEFDVPFPEAGGADACRQIRVKYVAVDDDSQYKGAVMAETTIGG